MERFLMLQKMNKEESIPQRAFNISDTSSCSTNCVFPFIYRGRKHDLCSTSDGSSPWCATSVNMDGVMTSWTYCADDCPGASKNTTPQMDFNFDNAPGNCCK